MNTCSTCKLWKKLKSTQGVCDMLDFMNEGEILKDGEAALDIFVSDDSGLNVDFITNENFGCIKHIAK